MVCMDIEASGIWRAAYSGVQKEEKGKMAGDWQWKAAEVDSTRYYQVNSGSVQVFCWPDKLNF